MGDQDKLDPGLARLLAQVPPPQGLIAVMIRTPDGLKPQDQAAVESVGGRVKADLYIVDSFSADVSATGLRLLLPNPRFLHFYHDAPVKHVQDDQA